jgi:cytochrome d ubiquinol oxidase subunit II
MGGGGLLAVFPLAYAVLLPATYPLIIAMLLGLVFRGVAFEFRFRDPKHEPIWDMAFMIGSFVAALSQGMILGALLQGVKVENGAYAGSWLDWLTPYTLLTGIGVVVGYALLGACWLVWRTDGPTQNRARTRVFGLVFWTVGIMALVSLYTLFLGDGYWQRWLSFPQILLCAAVPGLVALCALQLLLKVDRGSDWQPFAYSLGLFLLGFAGLGISIWPNIVPPSVSIWEAAAPAESQAFLLTGAAVIIPLILGYTGWAYWVFRGKTGSGGYH